MSVLEKVTASFTSDLEHPQAWLTDTFAGRRSHSGIRVTPESAFALSAYYACIRNIAEDIAGLPFKIFREIGERGREPVPGHSLFNIIHTAPNSEMSAFTFWELMLKWALSWGNGIAEIVVRGNNQVASLHPIHPTRVTVERDRETDAIFYTIRNEKGVQATLPSSSVFHLRGLGDELWGWSVARIGAESMGRALATQEHSSRFFGQGTTLAGVYKTPGTLDDKAQKRLRATWPSGLPNAHKPLFLESGLEWQSIASNPKDSQMIEVMQFTVEDIARWFRMPLHKVQSLLHATFTNIEHQGREYVGDTLLPWIRRIETETDRKLIVKREQKAIFSKYVVRGLLRGDLKAQTEHYTAMSNIGAYSINEIREFEGLNPIEGGDEHRVQMNTAPVGETVDDDSEPSDDAEPEPPTRNQRPRQIEAFKKSHARMFADVGERLWNRGQEKRKRATKRYADDQAAFDEWTTTFSEEHRKHCAKLLEAPSLSLAETICAACDVTPVPADVVEAIEARLAEWVDDRIGLDGGPQADVFAAELPDIVENVVFALLGINDESDSNCN